MVDSVQDTEIRVLFILFSDLKLKKWNRRILRCLCTKPKWKNGRAFQSFWLFLFATKLRELEGDFHQTRGKTKKILEKKKQTNKKKHAYVLFSGSNRASLRPEDIEEGQYRHYFPGM